MIIIHAILRLSMQNFECNVFQIQLEGYFGCLAEFESCQTTFNAQVYVYKCTTYQEVVDSLKNNKINLVFVILKYL